VRTGYAKVMNDEFIKANGSVRRPGATEVDIIIRGADPGKNSTCADPRKWLRAWKGGSDHRRYGCRAGAAVRPYQTW